MFTKPRKFFLTKAGEALRLSEIVYINAKPREHQKEGYETMTVYMRGNAKYEIAAEELSSLLESLEDA